MKHKKDMLRELEAILDIVEENMTNLKNTNTILGSGLHYVSEQDINIELSKLKSLCKIYIKRFLIMINQFLQTRKLANSASNCKQIDDMNDLASIAKFSCRAGPDDFVRKAMEYTWSRRATCEFNSLGKGYLFKFNSFNIERKLIDFWKEYC